VGTIVMPPVVLIYTAYSHRIFVHNKVEPGSHDHCVRPDWPETHRTMTGATMSNSLVPSVEPSENAQPASDDTPTFAPYHAAAGGWGALRATAQALREQSVALKGSKALLSVNQPDGFDCPGCAWPDPVHTSSFEFCENGAKAVAFELTKRRVTRAFFAEHTVRALEQQSDYWLEEQGRLTEPMRYDAETDHYVPVDWNEAFTLIGRELNALDDPNRAEFYTSGRTSNEAAFLYQLFVRRFGTNNFPDCSNMCHEPTSVGLPESIGIGKGTVLLDDFSQADAIFVIGQNPGTNSPRMMTELHNASHRGVPIVVFNPLRERALERFTAPQSPIEMATFSETRIASEYCQVCAAGDVAALKGVMKLVLEAHDTALQLGNAPVLDTAFIAQHTHGFTEFADDLRRTKWNDVLPACGLSYDQLRRVAEIYIRARNVIACYGMGITQHRTGSANVQQILNLLLLRGNIGRPGAGICPVRGHSNVQGDRTVGIDEKPSPAFLDQLGKVFGFTPPRAHGHNVVKAVQAMVDGDAKVFVGLGGNFVRAVPDRDIAEAAMRRMRLTVGINTKLNRGHLVHGEQALILPCLARSDIDIQVSGRQAITVEDSMSMVHASSGLVQPPSEQLKSEVAIVCGMADATLPRDGIDWSYFVADYSRIRDKIEAVLPQLFFDFNRRIDQPGGFHLTNPPRQRVWNTPTGRANFLIFSGVEEDPQVSHPDMLRLMTLRSHNQYNTTVYGLDDRYRGVFGGRMVVFINEADMQRRGIAAGSLVEIESLAEDGKRRVVRGFRVKAYDIPLGSIGAYYPETNPLLPLAHYDRKSGTPAAKSIPVLVRPIGTTTEPSRE
jgi:molybdopterin-dependent oxidoreductase alpha subunit